MSSPIMLINNTDNGYFHLKYLKKGRIMRNNNDYAMLVFVMETPEEFVDFQFVKDNNIKQIYRVTGADCQFRKSAIHYGLKKTLEKSDKVPGFRINDKSYTRYENIKTAATYGGFELYGDTLLPCPEYNNNDPKGSEKRKQYNTKILNEVIKKYKNEYTVYIAYQ